MSREAMQMALEALEDSNDVARMEFSDEDYYSEAINALRQALVDADDTSQERVDETVKCEHAPGPKAWQCQCGKAYTVTCISSKPSKKEWVGLTDEEVGTLTVFDGLHHVETPLLTDFARAIEAKLKEKNT